jgi:hypothetical protein
MPGILLAAALSIAMLGAHGGGPLGMMLVIATPVNFPSIRGLRHRRTSCVEIFE